MHAVECLHCFYEKELGNNNAKILFFYFPKEHIQDYVYHGNRDIDLKILEDLMKFFQDHYDANPPKKLLNKMIGIMRIANPLVVIVSPSILLTKMMQHPHLSHHPSVVPMTDLAIILVLVKNLMSVFNVFVTNAVSAKTPMLLNGMDVKCTILLLLHRWPKILTICASPHNPPNLVHFLLHPPVMPN